MGKKLSDYLLITKNKDEHLGITVKLVRRMKSNLNVLLPCFIFNVEKGHARGDKGQNKREISPRKQSDLKLKG